MAGTNNNNNGGMFDPFGLSEMLAQYLSNLQDQQPTLANNDFARETKLEVEKNVKDVSKMTEEEIKKAVKQLENLFTSIFGRSSNAHKFFNQFALQMLQVSKQMSMSTTLFSNLSTSAGSLLMQLSKAGNLGFYNLDKKGIDKNLPAQQIMAALLPEVGKKFDSVADKLLAFFGEDRKNYKTKSRQFIEDLVEGLSRSKFVGGAFTDLIRLITLFTASWLKDKGPIGKALAVGLVALGPIIAASIMSAIGKVATTLIGNIVSGITRAIGQTIGGILSKIVGQLGGSAAGSFFSNLLGTSVGIGGSRVAGFALGRAVTGTAANAITQGLAVGGTGAVVGLGSTGAVAGAGAVGAGAAGAATTGGLAAIVGPLLAIVAGIALIGGAIYLIVKNWDKLTRWCEETKAKLSELGKNWIDNINDWFDEHPVVDKVVDTVTRTIPFGGQAYEKFRNIPPSVTPNIGEDTVQYGKLKIGKYGQVLNAKELNQAELGRYMEAYRKEDKERFDRTYEIVPEGIASLVDFKKDATMRDLENGGKRGAILYKGATQDLIDLRNALIAGGMSKEKADKLMYTSGMLTGSGGHAVGGKHDNPFGLGFDLVGKGWNKEDMTLADPIIKSFYKAAKGQADYEIKKNGQYIFTTPDKGTSNALWDVVRSIGMIPTSAIENEASYSQWAEAKKKSIEVKKEEPKKDEAAKKEERPKTLAEQHPDSILSNLPFSKKLQKLHTMSEDNGWFIDFTGNDSTNGRVKRALTGLQQNSYEQQR